MLFNIIKTNIENYPKLWTECNKNWKSGDSISYYTFNFYSVHIVLFSLSEYTEFITEKETRKQDESRGQNRFSEAYTTLEIDVPI